MVLVLNQRADSGVQLIGVVNDVARHQVQDKENHYNNRQERKKCGDQPLDNVFYHMLTSLFIKPRPCVVTGSPPDKAQGQAERRDDVLPAPKRL